MSVTVQLYLGNRMSWIITRVNVTDCRITVPVEVIDRSDKNNTSSQS